MCGENEPPSAATGSWVGSSPRVRGKQGPRHRARRPVGLIPACAGKTSTRELPLGSPRAHPRVCGENGGTVQFVQSSEGSSARVRGKHASPGSQSPGPRLIPACAGKTKMVADLNTRLGAHPRVCGENTGDVTGELSGTGSSPRVRGKLHSQCVFIERSGLIPACAGKTATRSPPPPSPTAHPRVCGENRDRKRLYQGRAGSSPRVRGKHHLGRALGTEDRLIPACAGKTLQTSEILSMPRAHPRVCGENALAR